MFLKSSAVTVATGSGYPRNSCGSVERMRLAFAYVLELGARFILSPPPSIGVSSEGYGSLRILFSNISGGAPWTEALRRRSAPASCLIMCLSFFFAFGIAGRKLDASFKQCGLFSYCFFLVGCGMKKDQLTFEVQVSSILITKEAH